MRFISLIGCVCIAKGVNLRELGGTLREWGGSAAATALPVVRDVATAAAGRLVEEVPVVGEWAEAARQRLPEAEQVKEWGLRNIDTVTTGRDMFRGVTRLVKWRIGYEELISKMATGDMKRIINTSTTSSAASDSPPVSEGSEEEESSDSTTESDVVSSTSATYERSNSADSTDSFFSQSSDGIFAHQIHETIIDRLIARSKEQNSLPIVHALPLCATDSGNWPTFAQGDQGTVRRIVDYGYKLIKKSQYFEGHHSVEILTQEKYFAANEEEMTRPCLFSMGLYPSIYGHERAMVQIPDVDVTKYSEKLEEKVYEECGPADESETFIEECATKIEEIVKDLKLGARSDKKHDDKDLDYAGATPALWGSHDGNQDGAALYPRLRLLYRGIDVHRFRLNPDHLKFLHQAKWQSVAPEDLIFPPRVQVSNSTTTGSSPNMMSAPTGETELWVEGHPGFTPATINNIFGRTRASVRVLPLKKPFYHIKMPMWPVVPDSVTEWINETQFKAPKDVGEKANCQDFARTFYERPHDLLTKGWLY